MMILFFFKLPFNILNILFFDIIQKWNILLKRILFCIIKGDLQND